MLFKAIIIIIINLAPVRHRFDNTSYLYVMWVAPVPGNL